MRIIYSHTLIFRFKSNSLSIPCSQNFRCSMHFDAVLTNNCALNKKNRAQCAFFALAVPDIYSYFRFFVFRLYFQIVIILKTVLSCSADQTI